VPTGQTVDFTTHTSTICTRYHTKYCWWHITKLRTSTHIHSFLLISLSIFRRPLYFILRYFAFLFVHTVLAPPPPPNFTALGDHLVCLVVNRQCVDNSLSFQDNFLLCMVADLTRSLCKVSSPFYALFMTYKGKTNRIQDVLLSAVLGAFSFWMWCTEEPKFKFFHAHELHYNVFGVFKSVSYSRQWWSKRTHGPVSYRYPKYN
jgi:hypothetical protein